MTTMALATLTPSALPDYEGTGYTLRPGAKKVKYGGDYETRVRRSMNKSNKDQSLGWPSLPLAEVDALEAWLEDTYGVLAFNITGLSWIDDTELFTYIEMTRTAHKPGYDSVTVKLEKVFA